MDLVQLVDGLYKLVTGLATIGILWGVWKIAWWVQKVEAHMVSTDKTLGSQGSLLQQATSDISKIMGRLFGRKLKDS